MFDFEKNKEVSDISTIPEKYQGLYAKEGDAYKLIPAAAGLVADYAGVNKNLATARADLSKANGESAGRRTAINAIVEKVKELGIEIPEGADVKTEDAIIGAIEDLNGKVKVGGQVKIDLEKIKKAADDRIAAAAAAAQADVKVMEGTLFEYLGSNVVNEALAKHKGDPDLLAPHALKSIKVVKDATTGKYSAQVVDSEGAVRTNAAGNLMTPEDLVVEMKTHASYSKGFASDAKGGGGGAGGKEVKTTTTVKTGEGKSEVDQINAGLAKLQGRAA